MRDIKDYLPLYNGCEVQVTTTEYGLQGSPGSFKGIMRGFTIDSWRQQKQSPAIQVYVNETTYYFYKIEQVKMVLRKLSSMTEGEAREFCKLEGWGEDLENIVVTDASIEFTQNKRTDAISRFTRCRPEMFLWLLSKHFDLFQLIESGLAIDKDTL